MLSYFEGEAAPLRHILDCFLRKRTLGTPAIERVAEENLNHSLFSARDNPNIIRELLKSDFSVAYRRQMQESKSGVRSIKSIVIPEIPHGFVQPALILNLVRERVGTS